MLQLVDETLFLEEHLIDELGSKYFDQFIQIVSHLITENTP